MTKKDKISMSKKSLDLNILPDIETLSTLAASTTIPLSLRVKESTKALFDTQAQKISCTTNTLINSLLDLYADSYIKEHLTRQEAKLQLLQRHLVITAKKAGTLDLDTLLRETIETYRPRALFDGMGVEHSVYLELEDNITISIPAPKATDATQEDLIRDCVAWAEGKPTKYFGNGDPHFFTVDGVITAVGLTEIATVKDLPIDEADLMVTSCCLRVDCWMALMTILHAYEARFRELYPDRPFFIGQDVYTSIANCANAATDRDSFAQAVAQIILGLPFIQQPDPDLACQQDQYQLSLLEILVITLEYYNRSAPLSDVCSIAETILTQTRNVDSITDIYESPHTFRSAIRSTLEQNSKDCNPTTQYDYFSKSNKGIWHLNPGVYYDRTSGGIVTKS